MSNNEELKRLEGIVSEVVGEQINGFNENTVADDVEGWDSLNHLKIILAIEEAFSVEFEIEDITSFENVGDIITKINEQKGN